LIVFVEDLVSKPEGAGRQVLTKGLEMNSAIDADRTLLDTDAKTPRVEAFEKALRSLIIGQDCAIHSLSSLYQIFEAGMTRPDRPMGTMLFLGPTGSGKTRLVEATAEVLFGNANKMLKVDCAEFQHSHEIAKLIGSPPGYLGHRETSALLTQERLDRHITERDPFSLVLFDEIEKASDSLWQLLLGILDKATLSLGDNTQVDFSQTIIFMTSNLGAKEMSEMITGPIGFAPGSAGREITSDLDHSIHRAAVEAANRRFSPEFMNRIDKIVVFRSLRHEELRQVLDVELRSLQCRINAGATEEFTFILTDRAKDFLLSEGIDYRYGARHLKRAIERLLVYPLSILSATRQVRLGDVVAIDVDKHTEKELAFFRDRSEVSLADAALESARRTGAEIGRIAA
jgi:ATP-dependent Clp protease ATP-binding subunit ClpA